MANTENSMGTARISRLVLTTGIPLMLSMLINSLYNFVDSVFVSRVSEEALTALSLAAPVQLLVSSLGLGNAVGLNAAISKALGEKRPDKVKATASAAIWIALCMWGLICMACLLGVKWYFGWQSGGNEAIAGYGREYLSICMLFSLFQMGQWVFDRFVIASGKSHLFLFTLSAASLTNLALDPICIFGLFGVPAMGTRGAAIATVTGQAMGMLAGILINRRWNREIPFAFTMRPDGRSIRAILKVGLPSTLVQMLTAVVTVAMNAILLAFSTTAVAVYGICSRMQSLCIVGVNGIGNGLIPIVAYNFGARKKKRIQEAIRWGLVDAVIFYLAFLLVLELAPDWVLRLFNASDNMMSIGTPAVRILALAWLVSIPAQVMAAGLQGLSMAGPSMLLTMLRQAILPVVLAVCLRGLGSLDWIWLAFVLAEVICVPLAFISWQRNREKALAAQTPVM